MSALLQFSFNFRTEVCCNCSMSFAVPADFNQLCRNTGKAFYCPNGHPQSYTETEISRLQKQIEQEKKRTKWAEESRDNYTKWYHEEQRRRYALKGVVTKIKNRVGNGVCPCCQRTFAQLSRHMKNKHPDFIDREGQ